MYIYQSINGNLPITLSNIFKPTETLHGHNTRGSSHQMGFYDRGLHYLCNKLVFMREDFIAYAPNGFL